LQVKLRLARASTILLRRLVAKQLRDATRNAISGYGAAVR
jgi:hypothetical protein